jgi:transposase
VVALSIVSAIGDFSGFAMRDKLTSYLGLNPKVRQSGEGPPTWDASLKPAAPTPEP